MKKKNSVINVTKSYLPDINRYKKYIDQIYASNCLTNNGALVQELEDRLRRYLGVENIVLVSNGGMALHVAYKLLELQGEVITTPFSFVATTSTLVWDGLTPIYVDIDPETFNLNADKLEQKINEKTSAILPVHVFGNVCDIERIKQISKQYDLKVIYDAAHSFGVKYKGASVFNSGDISLVSFHATKLFHTIEGGALIINNDQNHTKAKRMVQYGYEQDEIKGLGINARMNEFSAAMGLSILDDMEDILARRMKIWKLYYDSLKDILKFQQRDYRATNNYHYFPIVLANETETLKLLGALNRNQIFPRRYFHPSLDTLSYVNPEQYCPLSRDISGRVLCLPLYPDLQAQQQTEIIKKIREEIGN